MIEVSAVVFGCQWDGKGHVQACPLRVRFGGEGPETTVDQMLEGMGHTYMLPQQLVELIAELQPAPREVELCGAPPPATVVDGLLARGYAVRFPRP